MWDNFMLNTNTIVFLLATLTLWLILKYSKKPTNLPPGPRGIPFVGYIPFLAKNPLYSFQILKKKYGEIFTIYFGGERVIFLSSHKIMVEALIQQGNSYSERPDLIRDMSRLDNQEGLFAAYGATRMEIRRFTLQTLRNFGMGKSTLEIKIIDEIHCIIKEIKNFEQKPAYLKDLLAKSVVNVLCAMMFGKRMNYDDNNFQQLIHLARDYADSVKLNQLSLYLPQFLLQLLGIKTVVDRGTLVYRKILEEIKKCKTNEESFVNVWENEAEKPNSNSEIFNEKRLAMLLTELFAAGSGTTSTTVEWALLYLIKYPQIQQKVQIEIDDVIGREREPSMSDQKLMPYTESTIMEVTRIATVTPLAVPHSTTEDTTLRGYLIPKNTTIFPNLSALHMDPEVFPEPEVFKPERFLTEDSKVKRIPELNPFSLGKRQCPGESLARMELFLYLTTLLQHFTFTKNEEVILDYNFGITVEPIKQKLCATLR